MAPSSSDAPPASVGAAPRTGDGEYPGAEGGLWRRGPAPPGGDPGPVRAGVGAGIPGLPLGGACAEEPLGGVNRPAPGVSESASRRCRGRHRSSAEAAVRRAEGRSAGGQNKGGGFGVGAGLGPARSAVARAPRVNARSPLEFGVRGPVRGLAYRAMTVPPPRAALGTSRRVQEEGRIQEWCPAPWLSHLPSASARG
jgi:hypothetical protein